LAQDRPHTHESLSHTQTLKSLSSSSGGSIFVLLWPPAPASRLLSNFRENICSVFIDFLFTLVNFGVLQRCFLLSLGNPAVVVSVAVQRKSALKKSGRTSFEAVPNPLL
jgi:hypothetical protein